MFAIGDRKWPGISKLVEECGEVLQLVGKLMSKRGEIVHWNVTNLKEALESELGDLNAAIDFVIRECKLDRESIHIRSLRKSHLFYKWHDQDREPNIDLKIASRVRDYLLDRFGYDPAQERGLEPWPADKPPRYNACTDPCDMWTGPCACGAWHHDGK